MRISKKKIEELREFFSFSCEYSGTEEVVRDTVSETLEELGSELVFGDEIGLTDGETEFATLDDFVEVFWRKSVELFLNVLGSE